MDIEKIQTLLKVLNVVKDPYEITLCDINTAFRKLALKLHPDKAGDEHTAAFQEVRNAHELLHKHFLQKLDSSSEHLVDNEKETFFRDR